MANRCRIWTPVAGKPCAPGQADEQGVEFVAVVRGAVIGHEVCDAGAPVLRVGCSANGLEI